MAGRMLMSRALLGVKQEMTSSAASIGDRKGNGNRGGTCCCNVSAREIRSSN